MRVIARPVWSGPSEKRKQAGASAFWQSASRFGTPSRVPRSVSTSILSARRTGMARRGSLQRVILVREVVVECELDRGAKVHLRLPAELPFDRDDRGHAFLDILVIFAEILARRHDRHLGRSGVLAILRIILEGGNDQLGQLGDADLVGRIADVEDLARRAATRVLDDTEERIHPVVDEGEGTGLFAAVDELERFLENDVGDELGEKPGTSLLGLENVVQLGADPVEGTKERIIDAVAHAVGVDYAIEQLLGAGINPALFVDRTVN